jgi:SAM-dependent methyltransferase
MLLPRYLLREDTVLRALGASGPCRVADIGCGGGEILLPLARRGHRGVAFDLSPLARENTRQRLDQAGVTAFRVVDQWPEGELFDVVLLLEVIGYPKEPVQLLSRCRELLAPGGRLLVSFVPPEAGYDPRVTRNMRHFKPGEMRELLTRAGFTRLELVNYGFPLANATVGLMNLVNGFLVRRAERRGEPVETGLMHRGAWLAPLGLVSNRLTIKPFLWLQRRFAGGERGNGFLAHARVD